MNEDYMLRCAHPLYDAWCTEDDEDLYNEDEYDLYAEAEAMWELQQEGR